MIQRQLFPLLNVSLPHTLPFSVACQQCVYDNKLLVQNGTHTVSQNLSPDKCTQSIALATQPDKAIALIFFNVTIDCAQQPSNNLRVLDANQRTLDYCQQRRSENTFYFIATQSTYVAIYSIGAVQFSFVVLFVNKPVASESSPTTFLTAVPTTPLPMTIPQTPPVSSPGN